MSLFRRTAPDDAPEVDRTGKTCRRYGHVVRRWGTICGWCPCCEHSVHTHSGRVLYYGEFYRRVPPHDEAYEQEVHEENRQRLEREMADHRRVRAAARGEA